MPGHFNCLHDALLISIWNNGGANTLTMRQSTGSGFTMSHWITNAGGWMDSTRWFPGDDDGDGNLNIAAAWNDAGNTSVAVYRSDKTKFLYHKQWYVSN